VQICDEEGSWGGFARSLSHRWPDLELHFRAWERGEIAGAPPFRLGSVLVVQVEPEIWVGNMLAKRGKHARRGSTVIDYHALDQALATVTDEAISLGLSVHMPRIGASLAGGQWHLIERIVKARLCAETVPVTVYDLSPQPVM